METSMIKLITAAVVAIAALGATAAPSFADSVTVRIGEPGYHDRGNHRPYYGHAPRRHPVRQTCRMKTVKYYNHGRMVKKTTRICR
jgi:hypothetical protein